MWSCLNLNSVQGNAVSTSMYLKAFPPIEWNVGYVFIFIQVGNIDVHEMWEIPLGLTAHFSWEEIQLQRNKKFRVGLRNCQIMSRNMLKRFLFYIFWHSEFESPSLKQPHHPQRELQGAERIPVWVKVVPEEGERLRLWCKWHEVHLISFRHCAPCFPRQWYTIMYYLYLKI